MNTNAATLELHRRKSQGNKFGMQARSTAAARARHQGFKLVHISDPHLSRQFYREHIKSFKVLLRSIVESGCDHLVISGDIVSTGDRDDYYLAREIFGTMDLLDATRLTVIPGNHDIFGGPHRATDVLSFPQHIRSVDYARRLEMFQRAFDETFNNVITYGTNSVFPFVKHVGPYSIIGLNSVPPWSLRKNVLGSNGILCELQRNGLLQMAIEGRLRNTVPIVAIHHHFYDLNDGSINSSLWRKIEATTMRMRNRRKILRIFESLGVRYVLHGHVHRNELYRKSDMTFLNGAGAVCDDPIEFLKCNELQYKNGSVQVRINVLSVPFEPATQTLPKHRLHYPVTLPALSSVTK